MPVNQLKAGVVLNYVIIGLNTLLGLLYTPYMLRCLGQSEYGLYSLVASVIAYLTILDFGLGNAVIRYTAKYRAEGKKQEQWELFGMFLTVYLVIGLIAFVLGMGLYFNVESLFGQTMTADELHGAQVMMFLLVVNLAITFPFCLFGSIITAYEDFVFQKVVSIVRILLSTAVIILLLHVGYKAIALVVVQTVFNVAVLLINYFYCKYRIHVRIVFKKFNLPLVKEISVYSFWIFLNAIMDRIYWSTGQFVLGAVSGTVAVSVFSVAILLQQMFMTFSNSISGVLLPKVTSMVANHSADKDISDLFIRTGRIQCIVMAFVLSGFVVFGQQFIAFWAGAGYEQSYLITLIFFFSLFTPLVQNTGIIILQARNQMKFRSLLYCGISGISLVLQIYGAKYFGVIGCACAVGGALVVGQGLVMNIYYHKAQRIDIIRFWAEVGRMMIVPTVLAVTGIVLVHFVDMSRPVWFVSGILVYSAVFVPLFWIFSLNDYERNLIMAPVRKVLRLSGKS